MVGTLAMECRYAMSVCPCVTFNLGSVRMFSTAISKTYVSCHKNLWIAATNYNMYLHRILLSPLTTLLDSFLTAS